jgi:hypothetical protein
LNSDPRDPLESFHPAARPPYQPVIRRAAPNTGSSASAPDAAREGTFGASTDGLDRSVRGASDNSARRYKSMSPRCSLCSCPMSGTSRATSSDGEVVQDKTYVSERPHIVIDGCRLGPGIDVIEQERQRL